jgi:hypothetical protein
MEARLDQKFAQCATKEDLTKCAMKEDLANFATKEDRASILSRLTDVKESLEREMNLGFEDMASRFDAQSKRLDRQAAMIQTGTRWTNRMNDWAENVDIVQEKTVQEIAELRARLEKLEKRAS